MATAGEMPSRQARRRARHRVSFIGVLGELLLTAGVVIMLFVVWQMWIGDIIGSAQNNAAGRDLTEQWSAASEPAPEETAAPDETEAPVTPEIPIPAPAGDGEVFGVMHIPRLGPDYAVRMGGGVSRERTLDTIGIGHYPGTQMPGEVGNSAVAAHRTGYGGAPFYRMAELRVGDAIVVETEAGWYTYRFRNLEYVTPSAVSVLNPIPQTDTATMGDRLLTLTSCAPVHTSIERIVAYSSFDTFTPRSDGPPPSMFLEAATAQGVS